MRRILSILYAIEATIAVTGFTSVAALLLIDVLSRELFGNGIFGAQRLAVFLTILSSYCGLGLAAAANMHLRPRLLDKLAPSAWDPYLNRLADLLSFLVFAFASSLAMRFAHQNYEFEQLTPILDWYVWPFQLPLAWGFGSTAIRYLFFFLDPSLKPEPQVTQE